jgi:hypothetical protein
VGQNCGLSVINRLSSQTIDATNVINQVSRFSLQVIAVLIPALYLVRKAMIHGGLPPEKPRRG